MRAVGLAASSAEMSGAGVWYQKAGPCSAVTNPFAAGLARLRVLGGQHRCAIMCG
jgi:hypothetical protein